MGKYLDFGDVSRRARTYIQTFYLREQTHLVAHGRRSVRFQDLVYIFVYARA